MIQARLRPIPLVTSSGAQLPISVEFSQVATAALVAQTCRGLSAKVRAFEPSRVTVSVEASSHHTRSNRRGGDGREQGEHSSLGAAQPPNARSYHQGSKEPEGTWISLGSCQTAHPPVGDTKGFQHRS